MDHIVIGATEISASIVGLVTGLLYGGLRLPIPAPNVLGGILAIWGTFIGLVIVQVFRGQVTFF
ncbi:MAG: XapX domain-containing protein [Candidimonas sp.]|nr:MAG: XapX domain-containing protein [Candidimonas sp.]